MKWKRYIAGHYPSSNGRILVSDGETITIVNFCKENDQITCFFENTSFKDINISWWKDLPKLPPKIINQIKNDEQQNSKTNQTGGSEELRN